MADVIGLPTAAEHPIPPQPHRGRYRGTVVPQSRVRAMRCELEERKNAPPPLKPDPETISLLQVLLQKAVRGEVRDVFLAYKVPDSFDHWRASGEYTADLASAAGVALRASLEALRARGESPPSGE